MGIDSLLNGLPELTEGQLSQNLPIVRIAVLLDREQPDSPRQNVTMAGLVGTYDGELYLTKSAFQSGDNLYHNGIQDFIYGRMPIQNLDPKSFEVTEELLIDRLSLDDMPRATMGAYIGTVDAQIAEFAIVTGRGTDSANLKIEFPCVIGTQHGSEVTYSKNGFFLKQGRLIIANNSSYTMDNTGMIPFDSLVSYKKLPAIEVVRRLA